MSKGKTIIIDGNESTLPRPESDEARKLEAELLRGAAQGPRLKQKGKIIHKKGVRALVTETDDEIILKIGKEGEPF